MSIGMGLRLKLSIDYDQRMTLKQRSTLKQLINLKQSLTDPIIPNTARGLEGMLSAHKILQSKKCAGVLIGGLSEAIWNQRRTKEQLSLHKDVDVLVLGDFNYESCFEGGIDWWNPNEERIKI